MNSTEHQLTFPRFEPGPLVDALVKLESLYVETRFHREAQETLRMLFRAASIPKMNRLTLAIIGPTGSGKSTALKHTVAWLRSSNGLPPEAPDPVSMTALSASTTPKEVLAKLLLDGGDPLSASSAQYRLERRLAKLGPHFKPLGLALDELHHGVENQPPRDVVRLASTLKNIVNHIPRPIIIMGVNSLDPFLDGHKELRMRFSRRVYLSDPIIQRDDDIRDIRRLLAEMAKVVPTANDCQLDVPEMLVRLLVASESRFGALVDMVKTATMFGADAESPVLRREDLSKAFRLSTNLESRSQCEDPFVMPYPAALQLAKQRGLPAIQSETGKARQA
jgi:Cdc6-like AAA superfamily ATPase